jgi:D-alanyl-D-alanine carboxypeptidase
VSGHYVQPAGAQWNLKLVNKWNRIDSNYAQTLVTYAGDNKFDNRAIDKLKALVSASNGKIRVASLYRSIELQTTLFNRQVNQHIAEGMSRAEAEEKASTLVARPGTSEHNLGLAVDFLFDNYSQLLESYENTATYKWMMEHCADYGFILRFPKNKQSVTGVTFEPWHYRYVGEEAAREIMSRGITLEQYLQEKGK